MQGINSNVFPKGGFVFLDENGVNHNGGSWAGVIGKVRNYRQRAGVPVGDVAAEVIAQACRTNPGLCREDSPAYAEALQKATLKTRVLRWISTFRERAEKEPLIFVSDEERKQRANVCAVCPHNDSLPGGCASCAKALKELRKKVIGARLDDARLQACGWLGEDLPSAVHLEQVRVTYDALPANCWRKSTH